MSYLTLILGESGSGKSTSLENLDHNETFIINVVGKTLPFRGSSKKYNSENKNYISTDNYQTIISTIKTIGNNEKYSHIKNLIIDDFQYIMSNEFMKRAMERGFDKFSEMAQHVVFIIESALNLRDDLFIFVLSHSEVQGNGKIKMKTIGKMLDDKITLEGIFTIAMHTHVLDGVYKFITNSDGVHIAKSPKGMFKDQYIDNDLLLVKNSIINYYLGENENAV